MRRDGFRSSPVRARFGASGPSFRIGLAVVALAVAVPALAASNILSNGEFSSFTVLPWKGSNGILLLSDLDHLFNSGSGSARLAHAADTFIASSMFSEFVAVGGGKPITVSGYFRTASSPPSGAGVQLQVRYYSNSSCTTYITPPSPSPYKSGFRSLSAIWAKQTLSHTTPSSARCAQVQIDTTDVSSPWGAFDLLADGLVLGTSTSTPPVVFASGFESGFTGWIVVD